VAAHIHLSPAHFQRLFTEWAGTSQKFLQYISLEHAKTLLKQDHSVFDAAYDTGLSSTSRLHDLFIQIEGMTPAEYKRGGEDLTIHYQYAESPFGTVLVASTAKGICFMSFCGQRAGKFCCNARKIPQCSILSTSR
jgi:AraC family transcriptional regulator of adaptative response/methylated-DNA-[protein]-cysteine methyltransferase